MRRPGAQIRRRRHPRGLTLVEALIASTVLVISLLGFSGMFILASKQDRTSDSRGQAQLIANEMAASISSWDFHSSLLSTPNNYTGSDFASPTVTSWTVTMNTPPTPPTIAEVFDKTPDHNESELTGFVGRNMATTNLSFPGNVYLFKRYWNIRYDSTANPYLKVIAVHVTFSRGQNVRGVATAFTAVHDSAALTSKLIQ